MPAGPYAVRTHTLVPTMEYVPESVGDGAVEAGIAVIKRIAALSTMRIIEVTLRGCKEVARDLVTLRLNPWWYPHGIYVPKDAQTGGPFTIGRVIHSSRGVGFTGWIGGVAVFNRALTSKEIQRLDELIPGAGQAPHRRTRSIP